MPTTGQPTSPSGDEVQLVADHVGATVEQLERRIHARFGERGLTKAARDLRQLVLLVQETAGESRVRLRRTTWTARTISVLISGATRHRARPEPARGDRHRAGRPSDWVPLVESVINDLVFASIAVLFLWAFPERLERKDAARACSIGCARWPTSSTCTSCPRTRSR